MVLCLCRTTRCRYDSPLAEKEQAMMTLRDIKANLGERLSKIKWQQDQLRLEKDHLTLELTFHQYFAATRELTSH